MRFIVGEALPKDRLSLVTFNSGPLASASSQFARFCARFVGRMGADGLSRREGFEKKGEAPKGGEVYICIYIYLDSHFLSSWTLCFCLDHCLWAIYSGIEFNLS